MTIQIITLVLLCISLFLSWRIYRLAVLSKKENAFRAHLEGKRTSGVGKHFVIEFSSLRINPRGDKMSKVLRFIGISRRTLTVEGKVTADGINRYRDFDGLNKAVKTINIEGISCRARKVKLPTLSPINFEEHCYIHFEIGNDDPEYCEMKLNKAINQILDKISS